MFKEVSNKNRLKKALFWVGVGLEVYGAYLLSSFFVSFSFAVLEGAPFLDFQSAIPASIFLGVGEFCRRFSRRSQGKTGEVQLKGVGGFYSVKEAFRDKVWDKTADEMCDHLLDLGIQTQMLQGHPLQKICTCKQWGREIKSLGLVQVSVKNIDYINVIREDTETSEGYRETFYHFEYLVSLTEIPSSLCRAWLNIKKRGLFRRDVVNIEWRGGTLADMLNDDLTLKQSLLTEFQQDRSLGIEVVPEPFYHCARVETDWHLPSRNMFDCLDRIAGLAATHESEVNGRLEAVLFEAKIELNLGSKESEVVNCCVTDRYLHIESREPVKIPWYMVEDCSSSFSLPTLLPSSAANLPEVSNCTVVIHYLDKSGLRQELEFEMPHREAVPLENTIARSYPKNITR